MKKSLIALAVLGASGVAMAQSSVTLYGVADAGVGKIKYGFNPDPGKRGNDASKKVEFTSASTMNNGNSRVGLRGVEDLGGGLKAGFQFETGLDLDNGAQASSGGQFWGRQANVWLGGNWGTLKLGRQFTPSFLANAAYELTGQANYSVQNLAYNFGFGEAGARANSAFAYVTPNFGGFSVAGAFVTKYDMGGRAAWDVAALYSNGPIGAGISANKIKSGKVNYQAGAKFGFSNFVVAASYTNASRVAFAAPVNGVPVVFDNDLRRRGVSLGASANFGGFGLTLDVTRDLKNEWSAKKYTNAVLEGKYALSKRTFVYAAALRFDGTNNYGLGVRHNF